MKCVKTSNIGASCCLFLLQCCVEGLPASDLIVNWTNIQPEGCNGQDSVEPNSYVNLSIKLKIKAIYDVSEDKMEFGMQIYLNQKYPNFEFDLSRLTYNDSRFFAKIIPKTVLKCLWQPDVIFANAKESRQYEETLSNEYTKLFLPDGHIYRASRYKIVASCGMDFHLFPMDSQICSLDITLLANTKSDVNMSWYNPPRKPVDFDNDVEPLNFKIEFLEATSSEKAFNKSKDVKQTLHARFKFVRSLAAALVNDYIPSFLIVSLSMVSFWLDVSAVPGRVTLGVTALLTLSTAIVHIRSSLPTLDYMTAMDIWLLVCMMMVFLSLIEFTMAQAWERRMARANQSNGSGGRSNLVFNEKNYNQSWDGNKNVKLFEPSVISMERKRSFMFQQMKPQVILIKEDNALDRYSRVIFPLMMLTFTTIYWVYFYNKAYNY